jgi:oligopeptide transport system permease protein
MLRYAVNRLVSAVPTLFLVVTLAFFLVRIAPGGPFDRERALTAQAIENLNRVYHFDEPLWRQYLLFLGNLSRGVLGPSFSYPDFDARDLIAQGLPASIELGLSAFLLAIVFGVTLGAYAAVHRNHSLDHTLTGFATFGVTVPNFVVGPVLSLVFGVMLGWLPAGGWGGGSISNKILPVITLALPQVAVIARLTRASLIEQLASHHVRTARAYGLPDRVVVIAHGLRGAVLPVVSYLGPAAAALLTGSVVVETVFGIPGVGSFFVQGALNRDYTLVMGTVVLIATFIVVFNLLVDLAYAVLDPRVRYD